MGTYNIDVERIKDLSFLYCMKRQLEGDISDKNYKNKKNLGIRNLRIFGCTCRFVLPYILVTGFTIFGFQFSGCGYPVVLDDVVTYKKYDLEYDECPLEVNEEYVEDVWCHPAVGESSFIVYEDWKREDGHHQRIKREYRSSRLESKNLYDALLKGDYRYLLREPLDMDLYQREVQAKDNLEGKDILPVDYFFQASLHVVDKSDVFTYPESNEENFIITSLEVGIVVALGSLIHRFKRFNYGLETFRILQEYRQDFSSTASLEEELEMVQKRILKLERKGKDK